MKSQWTDETIQFLRENYKSENKEMLCEKFNVSWKQIAKIANKNNIHIKKFAIDPTDIEFLKNNYSKENKQLLI